jgi:hypothetical protein
VPADIEQGLQILYMIVRFRLSEQHTHSAMAIVNARCAPDRHLLRLPSTRMIIALSPAAMTLVSGFGDELTPDTHPS